MHTPGPWLFRGNSSTVHRTCDTHPFGEQIFGFHDSEFDDRSPNDGDLTLILASPQILKALEDLYEAYGRSVTAEDWNLEVTRQAAEAILLAGGSV